MKNFWIYNERIQKEDIYSYKHHENGTFANMKMETNGYIILKGSKLLNPNNIKPSMYKENLNNLKQIWDNKLVNKEGILNVNISARTPSPLASYVAGSNINGHIAFKLKSKVKLTHEDVKKSLEKTNRYNGSKEIGKRILKEKSVKPLRDKKLQEFVLSEMKNMCYYCTEKSFMKPNGENYYEVHHLEEFSDNPIESFENVVPLLPQLPRHYSQRWIWNKEYNEIKAWENRKRMSYQ